MGRINAVRCEVRAMKATLIFPFILIALDIGAAVVYAVHGDVRHAIYWAAACVLTVCVTV